MEENFVRAKCEECGGKIIKKKVDFKLYNISLGLFPAEVCTKCGETVFDEKTSDLIDEAARGKGLWGLGARTKTNKVGSSIAVTINKKIADFMGLKQGKEILVHPESKHRLIIEVS